MWPSFVCWCRPILLSLRARHGWRLEYGTDWRQLVYFSRNSKFYPDELIEKWEAHEALIGPVSSEATYKFKEMAEWRSVTEGHVYRYQRHPGSETLVERSQRMFKWKAMRSLNHKSIIDLFKWAPYKEERWVADPKTWIDGRLTKRQRLAEEKRGKEEMEKGKGKRKS